MEEPTFKKDETPYLVFACNKCHQYSYVKTTQKTKTCLRCRRTHQVSNLTEGEIVKGMTAAVDAVKSRQTELTNPEFRSGSDFVIASPPPNKNYELLEGNKTNPAVKLSSDQNEIDYNDVFEQMLRDLSKQHQIFPKYLIEITAENYSIPLSELKSLISRYTKENVLLSVKEKELYYTLNNDLISRD